MEKLIPLVVNLGVALFIIWVAYRLLQNFLIQPIKELLGIGKNKGGFRAKVNGKSKKNADSFTLDTTNKPLRIDNPYRGILIVGGAGSGKSQSFVKPLLTQALKMGFTGIVYDFKSPELLSLAMHQGNDLPINHIDFKNPEKSMRCNPLATVKNPIDASEMATTLVLNLMPEFIKKMDFWGRSTISLLSGLIWYFCKNQPKNATLPHILAFIFTANSNDIVRILSEDRECLGFISSLKEAIDQGADKQIAGVVGTLKTALGIYNTSSVFWLLSNDQATLDVNNPDTPSILVIGNDSARSQTFAPLCSVLISTSTTLMNQPNRPRSFVLIDELPTIYLPNIETLPATARSNKVACILAMQDLSQLEDTYGKNKMEVIASNLGSQFYGRTTSKATAERVVAMFGKQHVSQQTEGSSRSDKGRTYSKSESYLQKDRIEIQEMTNLPAGKFVGIIAEGNRNECKAQIANKTDYTATDNRTDTTTQIEMTANFDSIYNDINLFLMLNTDLV